MVFKGYSRRATDKIHEPLYKEEEAPRSVEELMRRNVETICRLEEAAKEPQSVGDRVADFITFFCGSMTFVWVHVAWFGFWIGANILLPKDSRFDPYPFEFLTLIVSLEAIFLSTFILISQNRDSRLADRRNHLDLQVNLLSEQENTKMLQMLEAIARRVGADIGSDPDLQILEEATDPERLAEQIDATLNGTPTSDEEKRGKPKK
jgi:uncharacterized membrane protein